MQKASYTQYGYKKVELVDMYPTFVNTGLKWTNPPQGAVNGL